MSEEGFPSWYNLIKEKNGKFIEALEQSAQRRAFG